MRPHAEHVVEQLWSEHVGNGAVGHDLATAQHVKPVAVRCGEIEVVQRRDRAGAEPADQREELKLSLDVEVVGRSADTSWGTMLYWAQARAVFLSDAWLW